MFRASPIPSAYLVAFFAVALLTMACAPAEAPPEGTVSDDPRWVVYEGAAGPGQGKHIVLIAGDDEYRSEEALSQLGRILADHHGFKCTVLFAVDPDTGIINPALRDNIPGLDALDTADLAFLFSRWRTLPDDQMHHIDSYLRAGKPLVAMRTATHAFAPPDDILDDVMTSKKMKPEERPRFTDEQWGTYGHYGDAYFGPKTEWQGGFGSLVLGETWVAHHGHHKHESTLGILATGVEDHPILRGIKDGDIWGPSDVYTINLPLPGDSKPLVLGQVMKSKGEHDENDPFYGMRPDDGPPVEEKNNPMMPVAWTKSYQIPGGETGQVFVTTMGASTDLVSEGVRRLLVNGVYWVLEMTDQIPETGANVDIVGTYEPRPYFIHDGDYWVERQLRPAHFLAK